jgi:hypothetical protein
MVFHVLPGGFLDVCSVLLNLDPSDRAATEFGENTFEMARIGALFFLLKEPSSGLLCVLGYVARFIGCSVPKKLLSVSGGKFVEPFVISICSEETSAGLLQGHAEGAEHSTLSGFAFNERRTNAPALTFLNNLLP